MNKRAGKAINVLKTYLQQLEHVKSEKEGNNWKAKVLDTLKNYIGSDAALYNRFANEFFTDKITRSGESGGNWIDLNTYTSHVYNAQRKHNFVNLINDIIHHIELNGVKENYLKTNFLSSFSTIQILGGILVVSNIVYWSGVWVGNTQKDREIIKLEGQLKDTIAKCAQYNEFMEMQKKVVKGLEIGFSEAQAHNQIIQKQLDSLKKVYRKP